MVANAEDDLFANHPILEDGDAQQEAPGILEQQEHQIHAANEGNHLIIEDMPPIPEEDEDENYPEDDDALREALGIFSPEPVDGIIDLISVEGSPVPPEPPSQLVPLDTGNDEQIGDQQAQHGRHVEESPNTQIVPLDCHSARPHVDKRADPNLGDIVRRSMVVLVPK